MRGLPPLRSAAGAVGLGLAGDEGIPCIRISIGDTIGVTQVIPKMIQRVLVENWEPARSLDECQKKIVEIYTRYEKG